MREKLNVICWKWKGWRDVYTPDHVNALKTMLDKYLTIPHKLICITDDAKGIQCETYPLWTKPFVKTEINKPNCYRRLWLFSEEAKKIFGTFVLSIDLDCIILKPIDSLITKDDFKICLGRANPYNGSMWLHKTGTRTEVWDKFDPEKSPKLLKGLINCNGKKYSGSDQAWLSYILGQEKTWTSKDGVYAYDWHIKDKSIPSNAKIIFFPGAVKPWMLKTKNSIIYNSYMKYYR